LIEKAAFRGGFFVWTAGGTFFFLVFSSKKAGNAHYFVCVVFIEERYYG